MTTVGKWEEEEDRSQTIDTLRYRNDFISNEKILDHNRISINLDGQIIKN